MANGLLPVPASELQSNASDILSDAKQRRLLCAMYAGEPAGDTVRKLVLPHRTQGRS